MKFHEQELKGVWLIEPEPYVDDRGALRRHYCAREFEDHGIDMRIAQTNISENLKKYTLRGFHYQIQPYEEAKTISCMKGALFDIIIDLRKNSETFLKWISVEVDDSKGIAIHLPAGCANAYMTMTDNTWIHYYHSESYAPESYRGFRYNDPLLKFVWPCEPVLISEKDSKLPDFNPNTVNT
jgi:dTDP-4-dehydrorhamnose 3,5-epimerase